MTSSFWIEANTIAYFYTSGNYSQILFLSFFSSRQITIKITDILSQWGVVHWFVDSGFEALTAAHWPSPSGPLVHLELPYLDHLGLHPKWSAKASNRLYCLSHYISDDYTEIIRNTSYRASLKWSLKELQSWCWFHFSSLEAAAWLKAMFSLFCTTFKPFW